MLEEPSFVVIQEALFLRWFSFWENVAEIKCTLIAHDILWQVYYNEKQLKLTKDEYGYYGFSYFAIYDAALALHAEQIQKNTPAAIQMACTDGFTTHKE